MTKLLLFVLFLFILDNNPVYHLHNPSRLVLLDPDKIVNGVVKEIESEVDGDIHIKLKVNDYSLLSKNNFIKEDSCLILEIICVNKSMFKECNGYVNKIKIPNAGDTIVCRGLLLYDKKHKIKEIHPVLELNIIK